jgi:phage repressor protein C with HTH and peptisase S24 domain
MGVKERLLDFINYKQITNKLFELTAGLSNGYINNFDGNFRTKTLEKVLTAYPELNRNWLLYGEGEMLVADTTPRIVEASIVRADEEVEVDIVGIAQSQNITLHDIATIIGESVTYIEDCKGKLYPRHIMKLQERFGESVVDRYVKYSNVVEAEIVESFPVLPEEVTTSPNTDIVKYVEENGSELETINPNQLLNDAKVDVAERIKRTSMLPTFQPDDTVFIRFIKDKMKIVDGETYYLDCKNRPTMIRLVKFEGCDKLRLIDKNPQYGDIVIDRSDIINIGVVVALFRMTFGDQYSEIEAIRRQKDEQLEERHQQINSFIDIQREMIAEIREAGKRNGKLIDRLMETTN